jgi:3-isopropylmalate/(R)-2-methylmalate dehydratase small subunit
MASGSRIERVRGRGIALPGNDVDTDQIIPARYLRSIRFEGLEQYVFQDQRFGPDGAARSHPFNDPRFAGASLLVVNRNFGCGSSREHAPQALARWGIRAIVGESFGEIFFSNCTALGLPAACAGAADVAALAAALERDPEQEVELDLGALELRWAGRSAAVALPEGTRAALREGTWDALGSLLAAEPQIRATAAQLPYLRGF